jgi:segregation and condensation protein A
MAGKTIPWWQRVIAGAFRGIRAGVAALLGPTKKAEAIALVQDQEKQEKELSEDSPKVNSNPAPKTEPVVSPPAEIAEETPEIEPAMTEPAPVESAGPDAEEPAAIETPQEEIAESVSAPAADPETPEIEEVEEAFEADDVEGDIETAESAAETPSEESTAEPETVEAVEEAELEEPVEPAHEPSDDQPARPGQAIEETIVTPEIETEVTARQADLEDAPELLAEEESGEATPAEEATREEAQPVEAVEPEEQPIVEASSAETDAPEPAESQLEAASVEPETESAAESATKSAEPEQPAAPQLPAKPAVVPPLMAQVPHEPIKREQGPDTSPVSVIVSQVYEGPFDLLLDLIRKQDIDIYDIPIAKITAQFLAYVDKLKASDMDVAGEFIYTASLLIHIKSRMLLPREPRGPGEEQEDPRRELVERLLEHERFKNAAQMLQQKQMLEAATWTNPGMREFRDDAGAGSEMAPEIAADTTDLVRVFREILDRARNRPVLNLQEDSVTVGQMIQFLGRRLTMEDKPVALRRLLAHTKSERALIAMFLALLELVRLQAILLRQDRHFSEIFIKKNSGFDAVINEGMARDDWQ